MEFSLEGVLETLLVGALASLCLLSVLFLVVPHFLRVEAVRRLFRFFLYEDERIGEPSSGPNLEEPHRLFLGLLLCAGLYGSGLIAESLSDLLTSSDFSTHSAFARRLKFFSDPEIRIRAFDKVGASALRTGSVADTFAEFVSDYSACRAAGFLEDERYSPTCATIYSRARSFYYTAKNVVYRDEPYFRELSRLQTRIDFARASSQVLAALALLLAFAFLLGVLAEALTKYRRARWNAESTRLTRAYDRLPHFLTSLLDHWTHLAARRCLGTGLFAMVLAVSALQAWRDNEDEFDSRVFGYFLSHNTADTAISWALPQSTFRKFEIPKAERFEPSAVAALGDGKYVLVANDKGRENPLSIFRFSEKDGLLVDDSTTLDLGPIRLGKTESLHATEIEKGRFLVLAASTFDRQDPSFRRIVSFDLRASRLGDGIRWSVKHVTELEVGDPCVALGLRPGECVVEGMTSRDPKTEILLGIRFIGSAKARTPTLALVRLELSGKHWFATKLWQLELSGPFQGSGLSGLEFVNVGGDRSLLLLTSVEVETDPGRAVQVRGALWRIPATEIASPRPKAWDRRPRAENGSNTTYLESLFPHKPEGVTVLDNGSIVIVFDDDGSRKSRAHAPETFALDQNQSVFTIVRPLSRAHGKVAVR